MRYVCIHSHFYQPPRENPWLDIVEIQDSAVPYHDWNARIAAECYWPNAAARLLGHGNHITAIVNNYEALSFNFGPTLTAWFARHEPALLHRIVEADRLSRRRHAGHGNAIAQAYGHAILPLASPRDQMTQVSWGIQDFVHRFDRKPEGMWLPETAVNVLTLEALAAHNLKFTVLAPHQAKRIRPLGQTIWQDVVADHLDTNRPYLCRLPSGKQIVLFFYNSALARGVAFEGLLNSGDRFVEQILAAFQPDEEEPQLVHLATDGESYGHHHRFGEMALAFAVHEIEQRRLARVTNYGEYLAFFPPQWEVEIVENTSWSCTHGVERWRADCGCRVGSRPGWTQQWRAPLRVALDWLRDEIDRLFEQRGGAVLLDPWAARDAYIEVLLEHTPERIEEFCARHARKTLSTNEKVEVLKLLEMQRHRLLMFTSCGWFFDELSGLEGVQVLRYAAHALELAESFGVPLESEFIERLRCAPSNIPEWENGARVYAQQVKSAQVSFPRVVANQAICGILERERACPPPAAFSLARTDYDEDVYGATALGVGRITVSSRFTQEAREFAFAVLRVTSHDVHCVVSATLSGQSYEQAKTDLMRIFARHSLSEVVRELDRTFGEVYYTAKDLFLNDRRRVLGRVSEGVLDDLEEGYRRLYEENRRLMEYLRELEVPLPRGFSLAAEFLLDRGFTRAAAEVVRTGSDGTRLEELLTEARKWRVPLETRTAEDMICQAVEARVSSLVESPLSEDALRALHLLDLTERLGLTPNLWRAQTLFAEACRRHLRTLLARRVHEELVAHQLTILRRLAEQLGFYAVDGIPVDTWGV
jgi:alpha-amylase/alpha-mannosidase (GH57 family)